MPATPIDPNGLPASVEFLLFFKALGFTLHMVPMHIWFVGVGLSWIFLFTGKGSLQDLGQRLIRPMPVMIALGVNFGIVPLLFTQVLYYSQYYTAGILMAWPWLAVIPLLGVAYYGVYLYVMQVRKDALNWMGRLAAIISSLFFLAIGYLFVNNFSLMANGEAMMQVYQSTNEGGAVTGLSLNPDQREVFLRFGLMLGMALTTTAVWILVDRQFFAPSMFQERARSLSRSPSGSGPEEADLPHPAGGRGEAQSGFQEYYRFAGAVSPVIYGAGMVIMAVCGALYMQEIDPAILEEAQSRPEIAGLMGMAALSMVPVFLWIFYFSRKGRESGLRATVGAILLQTVLLVSNALSRQWVQVQELNAILPLNRDPVIWQWSSIIPFLLLFILGLAVIAWMLNSLRYGPEEETVS